MRLGLAVRIFMVYDFHRRNHSIVKNPNGPTHVKPWSSKNSVGFRVCGLGFNATPKSATVYTNDNDTGCCCTTAGGDLLIQQITRTPPARPNRNRWIQTIQYISAFLFENHCRTMCRHRRKDIRCGRADWDTPHPGRQAKCDLKPCRLKNSE